LALDDNDLWRDRMVAAVNHHRAHVRSVLYPALALVVDRFEFDDRRLQLRVEDCLRRHYMDAEDAALLLLSARGSVAEKRRWGSSQLVREVGDARWVREGLEGAAEGRAMPNGLRPPLTRMSVGVLTALAVIGGALPVPPDASGLDLAHEF